MADAAENGTAPDKVGKQIGGTLPSFITWMKSYPFTKKARKMIFNALSFALGAVVTALIDRGIADVSPNERQNVVNEIFQRTINQYIEKPPSFREGQERLDELRKILGAERPPNNGGKTQGGSQVQAPP
ncbi:MAG: hypothetical protein ACLPSH_03705 [Vulcanimicrobiaceae bacterium]